MDQRPAFRKEPITRYLDRVDSACRWLEVDQGRAARYGQLLREFYESDKRSREHILAYNESCEIVELHQAWESRISTFPGLERRIRYVFRKGPLLREDENPAESTNRPRNDAFVYLLAGKLLVAGIDVVAVEGIAVDGAPSASNADITFQCHRVLLEVECKRPQTEEALIERTLEARKQITDRGRHGVIAVDCSPFIRPPGTLFEPKPFENPVDVIGGLLQSKINPRLEPLLTPAILGFMLFARVPLMTRVDRSPLVSAQGAPVDTFRQDSLTAWLLVSNSNAPGSDLLRSVSERMMSSGRDC